MIITVLSVETQVMQSHGEITMILNLKEISICCEIITLLLNAYMQVSGSQTFSACCPIDSQATSAVPPKLLSNI